jgi:hypothetical protein
MALHGSNYHLLTGRNNHCYPLMIFLKKRGKSHFIWSLNIVLLLERYSDFNCLKRITAWILRFTKNCRSGSQKCLTPLLSTEELLEAEHYWISIIQSDHFQDEIQALKQECPLKKSSLLLSLHPIMDSNQLLRLVADYTIPSCHTQINTL